MLARSFDTNEMIAVVGASGFIGSRIAKLAGDAGGRVAPVTRQQRGDFRRATTSWFEGVSAVVYAAGVVPARIRSSSDYASSVSAAQAVYQASRAADVEQFVLVSSASVYGTDHGAPVAEDSPLIPQGEYGQSCVDVESLATSILQDVELTTVRPFSVYGPGGHGLVDRLLNAATQGTPVDLFAPDSVRDYIHVDDVARSVVRLIGRPGTFNLGTGIGRTTREVVELATAAHPDMESLITWKDAPTRNPDASVANPARAKRLGLPIEDRVQEYLQGGLS